MTTIQPKSKYNVYYNGFNFSILEEPIPAFITLLVGLLPDDSYIATKFTQDGRLNYAVNKSKHQAKRSLTKLLQIRGYL